MGCFYAHASDPDCAFDDNGGYHGEDGCWWKHGHVMFPAWEELLDRLLQNLEEGDDHDDRED